MSNRTTYVPLQSIIVVRDDKQVDALAEYNRTGKAFKFTADEIKEIEAGNDGDLTRALRAPSDEAADEVEENGIDNDGKPAASDKPKNNAKPAKDEDL